MSKQHVFKYPESQQRSKHGWSNQESQLLRELCSRPLETRWIASVFKRTTFAVNARVNLLGIDRNFITRYKSSKKYKAYIKDGQEWSQEDIQLVQDLHAMQVDIGLICKIIGRSSRDCVKRIIKRGTTQTKVAIARQAVQKQNLKQVTTPSSVVTTPTKEQAKEAMLLLNRFVAQTEGATFTVSEDNRLRIVVTVIQDL